MIPKNCRAECKPLPQAPGTEPTRFLTTVVLTAHDEPDTRSGIVDITTNTKGEWYTTTSLYPKMTTKENTKPAASAVNQQQQQTATTTKIQPDSQVDIDIVVEPEETELVYPLVENPFSGSLMVMISSRDEPTDTNFETSVPTVAEPVPESNIETNIYQSMLMNPMLWIPVIFNLICFLPPVSTIQQLFPLQRKILVCKV